jgi:hypothetical protein
MLKIKDNKWNWFVKHHEELEFKQIRTYGVPRDIYYFENTKLSFGNWSIDVDIETKEITFHASAYDTGDKRFYEKIYELSKLIEKID